MKILVLKKKKKKQAPVVDDKKKLKRKKYNEKTKLEQREAKKAKNGILEKDLQTRIDELNAEFSVLEEMKKKLKKKTLIKYKLLLVNFLLVSFFICKLFYLKNRYISLKKGSLSAALWKFKKQT